jgi:hypothetical protein
VKLAPGDIITIIFREPGTEIWLGAVKCGRFLYCRWHFGKLSVFLQDPTGTWAIPTSFILQFERGEAP